MRDMRPLYLPWRIFFSYSEVTTALVNFEFRKKEKESSFSETSAEILAMRGSSPNQRRENQFRSNWKPMVGNSQV